jgi:hypothetical protein
MSKQNKIHPAHYTQRGRLTQDDAAREIARQRSIGSQHTWQPVKRSAMPVLPFKNEDVVLSTETIENLDASPSRANADPAKRVTRGTGTRSAAPKRAPRAVRAGTVKTPTGKAKRPSAAKRATSPTAATNKRKAVLARNVGGPALKPHRAAKRRRN